jgi:hypothetical protein
MSKNPREKVIYFSANIYLFTIDYLTTHNENYYYSPSFWVATLPLLELGSEQVYIEGNGLSKTKELQQCVLSE